MVDYPVSRRTLIGSIGVAGAVASGAGGLTSASAAPAAIKPAIKPAVANGQAPGPATAQPRLEWVYDAVIQLQKEIPHGRTVRGERFRVPIIGGTFAGPALSGKIISGG
jgi:hypothetical protein